MQITFCGAAGTVTGSCFLVETKDYRFLVDCGMFQGSKEIREINRQDFLFNPGDIDFVLLTHAHIDHIGLVPRLWKLGFKNPVYATKASVALSGIVLPDSGHIQEMEIEWRNRKRARTGDPLEEPLYTAADAIGCLALFQPKNYFEKFQPAPGIEVRFLDAGHILGSSFIETVITEDGKTTKIVFSGDLGQNDQPIIKDPAPIEEADYLLVESTYGNRKHEESEQKVDLLKKLIIESKNSGGNLIIPAFAIGRTQDLLYHIKTLLRNGSIPRVPVYIDSPMAVSATEIYRQNPECYDEDTMKLFAASESPFEFPNLNYIRTVDQSKYLNETAKGAVIISASGMCEAGRVLHHLKHNLWRKESHILFVGYQAEGTLGRRLLEGAKVVKIMGEEINVQAKVHSIGGFSAHADQSGIMNWLARLSKKPRNIFIVHGENGAQKELADLIERKLNIACLIPKRGDSFNLEYETAGARILTKEQVKTTSNYFMVDKTVTDIEHLILNLHKKIREGASAEAQSQIIEMKKLLNNLEDLLKNSA